MRKKELRRPQVLILDLDQLLIDVMDGAKILKYVKRFVWHTRSSGMYACAEFHDLLQKPRRPLLPGAWELISWARENHVPLALDTERGARSTLLALQLAGISPGLFSAIHTRSRAFDVSISAEYPTVVHVVSGFLKDEYVTNSHPFEAWLSQLAVTRGHTLEDLKRRIFYIGDAPCDFETARILGSHFLAVPNQLASREDFPSSLPAAYIKNNLFEVVEFLEALAL